MCRASITPQVWNTEVEDPPVVATRFFLVRAGHLSDNPCSGKTYHTYYGLRDQVIEAVIQWLNGKDIRRVK